MKNGIRRRDFFKTIAAGGAATVAVAGCADRPEKLIPLLVPPDNIEYIPGMPVDYATTCQECPASCGVVIRTREGRALKAEGNPDHPISQGTLCLRGQASVQSLYNPARLTSAMRREGEKWVAADWDAVEAEVAKKIKGQSNKKAIVLMTSNRNGTRQKMVNQWLSALGAAPKVVLESLANHNIREANKIAFGKSELPVYNIESATYLVNFGADFLETFQSPVRNNREFANYHAVNEKKAAKNKFVNIAPHVSLTGANADQWVKIAPGTEAVVALALAGEVMRRSGRGDGNLKGFLSGYTLEKAAEASGAKVEALAQVAKEISKASSALVMAGGTLVASETGTAAQVAVNILNHVAGAVGKTIRFGTGQQLDISTPTSEVLALVDRMKKGQVKVLIVDGVNPLYHLPKSADVEAALAKVETIITLSTQWDETSRKAHYALPGLHTFEKWGDANPQSGVESMIQPVMAPLFPVKSSEDTLMSLGARMGLAGFGQGQTFKNYLMNAWKGKAGGGSFDAFWRAALQKGGVFAKVSGGGAALSGGATKMNFQPSKLNGTGLVLLPTPSLRQRDGGQTFNPWTQEIPDPVSHVVWDSWADINPKTAEKMGIHHAQQIRVKSPFGEVVTTAYLHYGIHEDAISIPLGQGHFGSGSKAADGHGVNVLDLLPAATDKTSGEFAYLTTRVEVSVTGEPSFLVQTDGNPRQDDRGIIQMMSLEQFAKGEPPELPHELESPHYASDFYRNVPRPAGYHEPYRWGMVVDVDRCTGCSACVAACYAENNLPVVGKERMFLGREMAWIRVERFIEGEGEDYTTLMQPTMCQQCGNAGCEPVCPVYATYHNPDGLNAQVYNRCVGTRYCSNNCIYKQRRYNWFEYEFESPLHLQLNPDVSKRSRGVMEKCTFCVHRIARARFDANDEGRDMRDGEVTPACAQTCPTQAITFGNLADPGSKVSRMSMRDGEGTPTGKRVRQYEMLESMKNLPAVTYLRKVTIKNNEKEA
ncbi:MAG: molybdopterin-dependent oxidoreductase [Deltaproteobacteria bacterium]|nr:molybdopterin-dependent oxidoreductase [Deltaproteobacteria bacterium]